MRYVSIEMYLAVFVFKQSVTKAVTYRSLTSYISILITHEQLRVVEI